jgi:hypothetical protein
LHLLTTGIGTSRTSGDVRLESAKWAEADVGSTTPTTSPRHHFTRALLGLVREPLPGFQLSATITPFERCATSRAHS